VTDDWESGEDPCRCRDAVTRAYRTLCEAGQAESRAYEAAVRIYRFHHPEAAPGAAAGVVERWIDAGTVH